MSLIYASIIFLLGIILGSFYKKLTHKLVATIKNKQEDYNKKNDENTKENEDEENEEIDFEEEDLKMVNKIKHIKTQ
jgi:hypothetical protein